MNRITEAVRRMDERLGSVDADAIARVQESATLEMGDWLRLGDRASRALLEGKVTADEAQTLHLIHTAFQRDATLAQRVIFLQCMTEVMA